MRMKLCVFILPLFAVYSNGWTVIQSSQDSSQRSVQPKQAYNPFTTPQPVGPSTKSRPFYSPSATLKPVISSSKNPPNSVFVTRNPFSSKSQNLLSKSAVPTVKSVIPTWKTFSPLPTPKSVVGIQEAYPKSVIPTWKTISQLPTPKSDSKSLPLVKSSARKAYTQSSDGSYVQSDEGQYTHNADGRKYLHNFPDLGLFGWMRNSQKQAHGSYVHHEGGNYFHHDGGRYIHDDSGKYIHVDNKYIHDDPGYKHVTGPNGKDWVAPLEPAESIRVPEVIYKPGGVPVPKGVCDWGAKQNFRIIRQKNELGQDTYHYLYETENCMYGEEEGQLDNKGTNDEVMRAKGLYYYVAPDRRKYTVTYTADENGFVPEGDHIPQEPPLPPHIAKALEYQRSKGLL